jgi:glycosyltransferase involved in cell wall biosynthesis
MRIGLVIYGHLDIVSGGYRYDRRLVACWHRCGDTVTVYARPWRHYLHHLIDNLDPAWRTQLHQAAVDVLLQDELNHPSLFWLNRRLRTTVTYPIISIVHHLRSREAHPPWVNPLYRAVERRYLATVDGFLCNSPATAATVTDLVGTDKPLRIALPGREAIPPAVDEATIRRRGLASGPLRLVFLGNLIPRKGLHTLMAALARLPKGSVHLSVIGNPNVAPRYAAYCRRQVERLGLTEVVAFRGLLAEAAVAAELAQAHVLAVPSVYEGFGMAYLEGMGYGLPALAGRHGGAATLITEGENGYLVTPGDVAGLSAHLDRLAADRDHLIRMSLAARERYLRHPTWEETAAHARAFLQAIVANREPTRKTR